jgi:hypothetical protein
MKTLFVDGWAMWPAQPGEPKPVPALLGANERRRAPDTVLVALHVGALAVERAGADAATLASVFTSAHGDLGIVDALCRTLADDPALLSPTRFHHSVHNAPSGYWAIATGSRAPSTALAAYDASFAHGLLEAACQAQARPVLLVGTDTEARGALAALNTSRGTLGLALVLAPERSARSTHAVAFDVRPAAAPPRAPSSRPDLEANALADALPVADALAAGAPAVLTLALGAALSLDLRIAPI